MPDCFPMILMQITPEIHQKSEWVNTGPALISVHDLATLLSNFNVALIHLYLSSSMPKTFVSSNPMTWCLFAWHHDQSPSENGLATLLPLHLAVFPVLITSHSSTVLRKLVISIEMFTASETFGSVIRTSILQSKEYFETYAISFI